MKWKFVVLVTLILWLGGCWGVCDFLTKHTPPGAQLPARIIEGSWFTRKEERGKEAVATPAK